MLTIQQIEATIAEIAPGYPIESAYLFGSYAEGYADDTSDVDIVIKAIPPFTVFDLASFQSALSAALKTEVDVVTQESFERSDLIVEKVVMVYERPPG